MEPTTHGITQVVLIIVIGSAAQLLAWRFRLPSIVLLLMSGLLVGPVFGLLDPDALLGNLLTPLVSLAVALILFEGGMTLRLRELPSAGRIVFSLVTLGAMITLAGVSIAAHVLLNLPMPAALLLGSVLVVSGPTVVLPLLQTLRPRAPLSTILKWEGILIDPIGVLLAVVMVEIVSDNAFIAAPLRIAGAIGVALVAGSIIGGIAGWIGAIVLRRHLIPEHFQFGFTLMLMALGFFGADLVHHEAGLVAATVHGIVLAELGGRRAYFTTDLWASLQPILVSVLFVVLAARLDREVLAYVDFSAVLFLLVLILVIRPLAVFISTFGSRLRWNEKLLLGFVCPRGIVAASLASLLSLKLESIGIAGAATLVPYTFLTVIGTVLIYGLLSPLFSGLLGVRCPPAQGVLIVGAHRYGRNFAQALMKAGAHVELMDSNEFNVRASKRAGLICHYGNALSETLQEQINFEMIGNIVAFTPNDEANSFICLEFSRFVGAKNVFQLSPATTDRGETPAWGGRRLVGSQFTFEYLEKQWEEGARFGSMEQLPDEQAAALAVVGAKGELTFHSASKKSPPKSEDKIVLLLSAQDRREVREKTSTENPTTDPIS